VKSKLDETQIPEIWETEDERLLSVNKLREKCIEYARSHFIKTPHLITEEDNKQTRDIESVSEFENWCRIEGKLYKIRIVVKKQPERYFAYYFGAVE
jgi:hypothetical protein